MRTHFYPILVAALTILLGRAAALAEIPMGTEIYTTRQHRQELCAFYQRAMSQAYMKSGVRNAALDDRAVQFLDGCAQRFAGLDDAPTLDDLERAGRLLYIDGCEDPMVQAAYARLLWDKKWIIPLEPFLQRSLDGLNEKSGYSPIMRMTPALIGSQLMQWLGRGNESPKYLAAAMTAARQAIEQKTFEKHEQKLLYDDFLMELFNHESAGFSNLELLNEWLATTPNADPWLVAIVGGLYQYRALNHHFSPDGYEQRMAEARNRLESAWNLNPRVPQAATLMIQLSAHDPQSNGADVRRWFNSAVAAQFDYKPAYDAYKEGLLSRSSDGPDILYEFGVECAATQRFDTQVPFQLIWAMLQIKDKSAGSIEFWKKPEVYKQAMVTLDKYIAESGKSVHTDPYRTYLAGIAAATQHWPAAASALNKVQDRLDPEALSQLGRFEGELIGEIRAYAGPSAEKLVEADWQDLSGQHDAALAIYRELASTENPSPEAQQYLRSRLATRELEASFRASGKEWVNLRFDEDLSGWKPLKGNWRRETESTLLGEAIDGGLRIKCLADFGDQFEFRAQVEVVQDIGETLTNFSVTLCGENGTQGHELTVYPIKSTAMIFTGFHFSNDRPALSAAPKVNLLAIRFDRGRMKAWLNDEPLYADETLGAYPDLGYNHIALGGFYLAPPMRLRFSDLQVRRAQ